MTRVFNLLAHLFPVWVLVCSALALVHPEWFLWFHGQMIVLGLAVIMLGMGLTLRAEEFTQVLQVPRPIILGFAAQYLLMPFLGWSIAHLLQLETALAVGLILVSCCPGGTASNVVTYMARANLALSVLMTMCSTFGAIFMTPVLTRWLAGTLVPVDAWGLFFSTVQVVFLPLLVGMAFNRYTPRLVQVVLPVSPLIAVITIALICASIIGQHADLIRTSGGKLFVAVALLHVFGFVLGYLSAWVFRYEVITCRTVSIEVGMQNSGLGVVLAKQHFHQLSAVPCAISGVMHSIIGSILAIFWRFRPPVEGLHARLSTSHWKTAPAPEHAGPA